MTQSAPDDRLDLPQVTLVAVTSVNIAASLRAIEACQRHARFAACKLLTHIAPDKIPLGVEVILMPEIATAQGYSQFMLRSLADHVGTSHCLVVQWDGHIMHPDKWDPQFLEYDYIGASWPQFTDGHDVGNGGFSLRSQRLIKACGAAKFMVSHPEDVAIGRANRTWLEAQGLRFAPRGLADRFSAERASLAHSALGYHGVWHMPSLLGVDEFWKIYQGLDDRTSVYQDLGCIMRQLVLHPRGLRRCVTLVGHWLRSHFENARNQP